MGRPKRSVNTLLIGKKQMRGWEAKRFKIVFSVSIVVICLLAAASQSLGAGDLALPERLEYVNVELTDIFRDLAAIGKVKVLFAHQFQKKTTMVIESGSALKRTIAEIATNHGLMLKWLNTDTVVIGNSQSLRQIRTTDLNLRQLPLRHIPPTSISKALETIVSSYRIRYDFKTNEIAVMANSLELQNIKNLIEQWDRDLPIINMEIEVVEVTNDFLQVLGLANSPSPPLKVYPLTKEQMAIIDRQTGKNLLARQEVLNLNKQTEKLFFGDQIPIVSEENIPEAVNYQIGYLEVGTMIDYSIRVEQEAEAELLVKLQATVKALNSPAKIKYSPTTDMIVREINTSVGLKPGDTIILTGALKRDEYVKMKSALYEFPFLESLFYSSQSDHLVSSPETTAILIFMRPSFTEKVAYLPPTESPKPAPVVNSAGKEPDKLSNTTNIPYIIKRYDTLTSIAKKFGINLQSIIQVNQLKNPGVIKANATLMIPVPNERIYVLKYQETIWRLAKRYGTTVAALKDLNSITDVTKLKVGQKLVLPGPAKKIVNPDY